MALRCSVNRLGPAVAATACRRARLNPHSSSTSLLALAVAAQQLPTTRTPHAAAAAAPFSTRPARRRQWGVNPRRANAQSQQGGQGEAGRARPQPRLQDTLRKFYLKVHPDLFTHYPREKEVNQEAFSRFQAFLDDVRDKDTPPPRAGVHSYKFYLKTAEEGRFREVSLEMRTTGGDCRNLVQRSLEGFFGDCGLPEKFTWAEGDWSYTIEERMTEEEREELRRQEESGYY